MKKILRYFCIFICVVLLSTCKKYDEGGTVHAARRHLFGERADGAMKTWKLKLFEVDGVDSTYLLPSVGKIPNYYDEFLTFRLLNHEDVHYTAEGYTHIYGGYLHDMYKDDMIMSTIENKFPMTGTCYVRGADTICWRNIFRPEGLQGYWKIKKLTDKEFIIVLPDEDTKYDNRDFKHRYRIILVH